MKNNNNKLNFILEIFWLIMSVLLAGMAVFVTFKSGLSEAKMFYVMMALSLTLYVVRRMVRVKSNKK